MDRRYCPRCTDLLGKRPPVPTDPPASTYQEDKYDKHMQPSTEFGTQSVFNFIDPKDYVACFQEVLQKGGVHESYRGTNVVFCPSTQATVATMYRWGKAVQSLDTYMLVFTSDPAKMHMIATEYPDFLCDNCGGPFLPLR